jgi:antitoxin (DNA-binding transcriptional repressor) of toxin-antitoxin stability system
MMPSVNMLQAKSSLSRLVEAIEQGKEREIVIARNGRPVARLVPMDAVPAGPRIGVAKGKFEVPDSIDTHNDEIARMFLGGKS